MSEPLKRFLDTAHDNNVDDMLLSTPVVENTLDKLENYGKDLEENVKKTFKRPPAKPSGPTPTYEESAFIKPKTETTLYNVTNREKEVPTVTKFFKKASYSVRGFSLKASYRNDDNKYCLLAGEKTGLSYVKREGFTDTELSAAYNIGNKKTSVEYSVSNSYNTYSISVFNQRNNNGLTASYSNREGFYSAFSIDEHSASVNCGYNKKNISLSAYATTGDDYNNPFAGISGRMTF